MKFMLIALLCTAAGLAACERAPTTEAAREPEVERSFAAERDHYTNVMRRQLDEIEAEIEELGEDTTRVTGKAKREFEEGITDLRLRLSNVEDELDDLGESADESWTKGRDEVDAAFKKLEKAYNNFTSKHFK